MRLKTFLILSQQFTLVSEGGHELVRRANSSSTKAAPAWADKARGREGLGLATLAIFCNFLAGTFSAVSKRNFARKYAFDSIFQALQDVHSFAPLRSQNFSKNQFEKSAIFVKIQQLFANVAKSAKCCQISKIAARESARF